MATITLNIPDQKLPFVVDALCDWGNYDENQFESETRGQFAKRMLAQKAKSITISYLTRLHQKTVDDEIANDVAGLDIT
jgi:hypothetical protein